MKRTHYNVEISYEDKQRESIPLTAKTDKGAMRQAWGWVEYATENKGNLFLHFYHSTGGSGYLDADGWCCVGNGRSWN